MADNDIAYIKETVKNPSEVLPNIAEEGKEYRAKSVLLVKQNGKDFVSIVEITPDKQDNIIWNYWKMSRDKADAYLDKFRKEKTRILQAGGRPFPHIPLRTTAEGKPEGLSGSQPDNAGSAITISSSPEDVNKPVIIPQGKAGYAYTPDNKKIDVSFAVADAGDLITSHDTDGRVNPNYPKELQPRDREKAGSLLQINQMANSLKPELLEDTKTVTDGSPIVGNDGIVESGNGRTLGIRKAYEVGRAEQYRQYLLDNADRFGLDRQEIERIKNPVLVLVRQSDVDRGRFVKTANERTTMAMSPAEVARMDADRMSDDIFSMLNISEDGNLFTSGNREFVRRFISLLPQTEQAQYVTSDGYTKQLHDRMQSAIFAKAYQDKKLVSMQAEEADIDIQNIISALLYASPEYAGIRANYKDLGDLDLIKDVIDATSIIREAKTKRMTFAQWRAQGALFGESYSDIAIDIAKYIADNIRSSKKIGVFLREIGVELRKELDFHSQDNLFGIQKRTKEEIYNVARERIRQQQQAESRGSQAESLFNQAGDTAKGNAEGGGERSGGEKRINAPHPFLRELLNEAGEKQLEFRDIEIRVYSLLAGDKNLDARKEIASAIIGKKATNKDAQLFNLVKLIRHWFENNHYNRQEVREGGQVYETGQEKDQTGRIRDTGGDDTNAMPKEKEGQTFPRVILKPSRMVHASKRKTINHTGDAANYVRNIIQDLADEAFLVLAVGRQNKPVGIILHSKGSPNSSLSVSRNIIGSAKELNASIIYLVHNHPSGTPTLSSDDLAVYRHVSNLSAGIGVYVADMIALTKDKYASERFPDPKPLEAEGISKSVKVPLYERYLEIHPDTTIQLNSSNTIDYVKQSGLKQGVLLMSVKLNPAGYVRIDNFERLRGRQQDELIAAMHESNASTMIAIVDDIAALGIQGTENILRFARAAGIKLMDVVDPEHNISLNRMNAMPYLDMNDIAFLQAGGKGQKPKLTAGEVKDIVNEVVRISAPETIVETKDRISPDAIDDVMLKKALERWGKGDLSATIRIKGMHRVVMMNGHDLKSLITLSLSDMTKDTPYHEAMHSVLRFMASPEERKRLAERYPDKDGVSSTERISNAFGEYAAGRRNQPVWVRQLFERVKTFLENLKSFLAGRGWKHKDVSDIFEDVYSGRLKERYVRGEGASIEDLEAQIKAYHGSPYKFDRFDSSKIGTGEGAQSFGWGLYFTDEKDIARHYAKEKRKLLSNGIELKFIFPNVIDKVVNLLPEGGNDKQVREAIDGYLESIKHNERMYETLKEQFDYIKEFDNLEVIKRRGNVYTVTIHKGKTPEQYDYLNWYDKVTDSQIEKIQGKKINGEYIITRGEGEIKLLSNGKKAIISQDIIDRIATLLPEGGNDKQVREAIDRFLESIKGRERMYQTYKDKFDAVKKLDNLEAVKQAGALKASSGTGNVWYFNTGEQLYQMLSQILGSDKAASLFLLKNGIDGIKYKAGTLTGVKDSTAYNYVVFDPNAVYIEDKISLSVGENSKDIGSKIVEFAKTNRLDEGVRKIIIGKIKPEVADWIKKLSSIDVGDYVHEIDNYAVRHALRGHSKDINPLTVNDMALIPEIINNPDNVTYEGKTKQGLDAFKYVKKFNGYVYYVEEVRTGKKTLNLKTMYKIGSASHTHNKELETIRLSDKQTPTLPSNKSITPSIEDVNDLSLSITSAMGSLWDKAFNPTC